MKLLVKIGRRSVKLLSEDMYIFVANIVIKILTKTLPLVCRLIMLTISIVGEHQEIKKI